MYFQTDPGVIRYIWSTVPENKEKKELCSMPNETRRMNNTSSLRNVGPAIAALTLIVVLGSGNGGMGRDAPAFVPIW